MNWRKNMIQKLSRRGLYYVHSKYSFNAQDDDTYGSLNEDEEYLILFSDKSLDGDSFSSYLIPSRSYYTGVNQSEITEGSYVLYENKRLRKLGLLLCLALITVITLKITLDDHKCGMEQILFTTAAGKKKLLFTKCFTIAILALLMGMLLSCADIMILARWNPGELAVPIQSFRCFASTSFNISMQTAIYLTSVLHIIFFVVYSLVLTLFASITQSDIAAVAVTAVISSGCIYAVGTI